MGRRVIATLAVMVLAAVALPAAATISEALDLEDLVRRADHVVVAEVVGMESHYDDRRRIVTDVTVRVDDCMKGPRRPGEEVVLRRLGGEVGDVGMRVAGEPTFEVGQRAVLFARDGRAGPHLRPVGMSQGVLTIRPDDPRGDVVLPGGQGLSLVERGADGRLGPAPGALIEPRPLGDVLDEIRAMVDRTGGR